jgi:transcriptional regulator with XRE-family HTH domain
MHTLSQQIPVTFADFTNPGKIPQWARAYKASRATVAELCKEPSLPNVSVIRSTRPKRIIKEHALFIDFCNILIHNADASSRLVLGFKDAEPDELFELAPLLGEIPGLTGRIDLAQHASELQGALIEALTKVMAARSEQDPLGKIRAIAVASRSLRSASGRLDARKIAEAFGLSLTSLANQIGLTKQRISKTPDSEAVQPLLRPYERIARLRTILSEAAFKAWLNTPNEHLEDGDAPIDYLKAGAQDPIAYFAENMLTGTPT